MILIVIAFFKNIKSISIFLLIIIFVNLKVYRIDSTTINSKIQLNKTIYILNKISQNSYLIEFNKKKYICYENKIKLKENCVYKCNVLIKKLDITRNFFSFDYLNYLRSQNIFYRIKLSDVIFIKQRFNLNNLKNKLFKRLKDLYGEKESVYLIAALLLNEKNSKKKIYNQFKQLNISHFLAISGMHLGIFFIILNKLFKFFSIKIFYILFFFIMIYFIIIADFSPSILRASFISIFCLISELLKRDHYTLETLGIFSILFLSHNPYIVYDNSFFFSVLFFSQLIIHGLSLRFYIILIFQNLLFNSFISLLSIPANIIIMFFFPFIMVNSFFILIFSFFNIRIPTLLFNQYLFMFVNKLINNNYVLSFNIGILCFLIISILLIVSFKKKSFLPIILIFSFTIYLKYGYYMIVFDAGHGQSILINSGNFVNVFDTGNKYYNTGKNITSFLTFVNKKIDFVHISHMDFDHYSGLISIDPNSIKNNIFVPEDYLKVKDRLNNHKKFSIKKDFYYVNKNGIDIWAFQDNKNTNKNASSFIYNIKVLNKNIAILSDIDNKTLALHSKTLPFKLNHIILPHHGGKNTINKDFIQKYNKSIYYISCNSRFNNPNKETLDLLKDAKLKITKDNGAIFIDMYTGISFSLNK